MSIDPWSGDRTLLANTAEVFDIHVVDQYQLVVIEVRHCHVVVFSPHLDFRRRRDQHVTRLSSGLPQVRHRRNWIRQRVLAGLYSRGCGPALNRESLMFSLELPASAARRSSSMFASIVLMRRLKHARCGPFPTLCRSASLRMVRVCVVGLLP